MDDAEVVKWYLTATDQSMGPSSRHFATRRWNHVMTQPGYLRHPTLHRETIVFVSDDDLWSVDASGGVGRRLTAGLSEPATPCLSPDGHWIAFVGRDEQHPEVYRMRAEGGPAQRMTWLGPDVMVRGWTPRGTSCS